MTSPANHGYRFPPEISATIFHITRGEMSSAVVTTILLALVSFVAYTRWKVAPILPRTAA
jgi:hypothetical protein